MNTKACTRIRIDDRGDGLYGFLQGIKCGDGGRIGTNYTSASCSHETLCVYCTLSRGKRHEGCQLEACRAATNARIEIKRRLADEARQKLAVQRYSAALARKANRHMRIAHRIPGKHTSCAFEELAWHTLVWKGNPDWYKTVAFCELCGDLFHGDPKVAPPEPRVVWFGALTLEAHPDIFFEREHCEVCSKAMRVRKKRWHYWASGPQDDPEYPLSNRSYYAHEECGRTLPSVPPNGTRQDYPYWGWYKAKPDQKCPGWKNGTVLGPMILENGVWLTR